MVDTWDPRRKPGQNAYQLNDVVLQQKEFTLSSAEILALNTTPQVIVKEQGPGKIIEFVSATLFLNYGSAAYATNGGLNFLHGAAPVNVGDDSVLTAGSNVVSATVPTASLLFATADAWVTVYPVNVEGTPNLQVNTPVANGALGIGVNTGDPTAGDSTIRGIVTYRIVDFREEA